MLSTSGLTSDEQRYNTLAQSQLEEWEALCGHCGACCGAFDDPCEHLAKLPSGKYRCTIYEYRFGWHKTVSGKSLQCVPIRNILHTSWQGDACCGYKETLLR